MIERKQWRRWESNPREVPPKDALRSALVTALIFVAFMACFLGPLFLAKAFAHVPGCRTTACDRRVHAARVIHSVERKIHRVAPMRCYGQPSAVPCWIVTKESRGSWLAWNSQTCGYGFHARGFYQLCGHGEPWPVLVRSRYETLKRKLAHHRIAHHLWQQQQAGQVCAWCYGR